MYLRAYPRLQPIQALQRALRLELGSVDLLTGRLDAPGGPRALSEMELELLTYLASRPGEDVPREALYREVWGYSGAVISRTVDLTVSRLRARVERDPSAPRHIHTVYGVGYRFEPLEGALPPAGAGLRVTLGVAWVSLPAGQGRGPAGEPLRLSPTERALLLALHRRRGEALGRRALEAQVWPERRVSPKALAMTVRSLRVKLEATPAAPAWLVSPKGGGYCLRAQPARREPPATGALFGREEELRRARQALESAPLLSLVGSGGAGKTRLAMELARGREAVFCALSDVREGAQLLARLAHALGLDTQRIGDAAALTDALRARMAAQPERLIVLDNLEQVPDAGAAIAPLRGAAPLLATSRRPLRVRGERLLRVGPLPEPVAQALFAERAGLDPDHPCVAPVVERLEGMPLALEIAAAQLGHLSPEELLARVRSAPLTLQGAEDLPERHRSIEATIRWSWELLEPEARRLMCWLAPFVAGFTAETAEAALSAWEAPPELRVLLDTLRARSLLELDLDASTPDAPRLRMNEVVRAFALEQLRAEERAAALGARRRWAVDFAERERVGVRMGRPAEHLRRLSAEHANLLAVFLESAAPYDAGAVTLLRALTPKLRNTWTAAQRRAWIERLLADPHPELPLALLGRLLQLRLQVTYVADDYLPLAEQIVALADESGDVDLRVSARVGLLQGLRAFSRPGVEALAHVILSMCEARGRYGDGLLALSDLAVVHQERGEDEAAEAWLRRGLAASRREGELYVRPSLLNMAIHLHGEWGLLEDAEALCVELLELLPLSAHGWMAASTWGNRGLVQIELGRVQSARDCLERCLAHTGLGAISPSYRALFEALRQGCDLLDIGPSAEGLRAAAALVREVEAQGTGCPHMARAVLVVHARALGRTPVARKQLRVMRAGAPTRVEGALVAEAAQALAGWLDGGDAEEARARLGTLSARSQLVRVLLLFTGFAAGPER